MYKLLRNSPLILRVSDGATIPADERNADRQAFILWRDGWTEILPDGSKLEHPPHTPEPADPPPPPTKDELDTASARADSQVQALATMSPAEAAAWIDANVTDLPSARAALRRMAKILCILARRI
jgi:hypothetical protein